MKRGQSALEYLVTYGWAILAIVIIAAVLWYFGVFNPAQWTESKGSGGFTGVTVIDYTVADYDTTAGTANVTMVLGNKVGRTVSLTGCYSDVDISLTTTSTPQCSITGTIAGNQINVDIPYTDTLSEMDHTDSGFVRYTE
jgi:hypothetical protein